jgi:hypothetical protein
MLLELLASGELESYQQGRIAISGWIKALMLGEMETADAFARNMQTQFPQLVSVLQRYLDNENKLFDAALILVYHPGFTPLMPTGYGRYQYESGDDGAWYPTMRPDSLTSTRNYNWWCEVNNNSHFRNADTWETKAEQQLSAVYAFNNLNDERRSSLISLRPRLNQSMTAFFGPFILEHARSHPEDPRVPLALYRLVFATRYACKSGPGEISRQAFQLLHTAYPDSESAKNTPFWYN